jgi:hypothetical protein
MKIYAVRNKETGEFLSYNGRVAWSKAGNAKRAFDLNRNCLDRKTFDSDYHKLYDIVELTETYNKYYAWDGIAGSAE